MFVKVDIKQLAQNAIEYSSRKEKYSDFLMQLLNDATKEWEKDNHGEAIKKCNEFISLEPQIIFSHLFKALLLTSQKKYSNSQEIIETIPIEKLDQNENELRLFTVAINLFYTNQFCKSLEYSNAFIESDKGENRTIFIIRGYANASLENHKEAIKDFKIALKDNWEVEGIRANLAYSYLRNKNHLKALLIYRKVVKKFPNHWKVQYNTGLSYFKFRLFRKAMPYLNRTEELNPEFPGTYLTRGFIHLKKGNRKLALKDWTKAKDLGAKDNYEIIMKRYYWK